MQLATIVVMERPGHNELPEDLPPVLLKPPPGTVIRVENEPVAFSSTAIRAQLAQGVDAPGVAGPVLSYIEKYQLYRKPKLMNSTDATAKETEEPQGSPSGNTRRRVEFAVRAAEDRKAVDLAVLALGEISDFTDYFVVCSGTSDRQVRAIATAVESELRDHGIRPLHVEGLRKAQWVLMDYGDFLVHVFDKERREFYRLERLWSDAPDETASFLQGTEP